MTEPTAVYPPGESHPPHREDEVAPKQQSPSKVAANWWRSLKTNPGHEEPQLLFGKRPALGRSAVSSQAIPGVTGGVPGGRAVNADGIPLQYAHSPIFGVPLDVSLPYAGVRISLVDREGDSFVYGVVPAIIAKCAVYLKQNARTTEGIFRIPGSVRRIRMLQDLFSTPPAFGKGLDWSGFTVHDAANLLKRYFAALPEPVIPRSFYDKFRYPLQHEFAAVKTKEGKNASEVDPKLLDEAITYYENLIDSLPKSSSKLLLYLIDLLSVFSSESEANRMPAYNLSAIFQPSVLTIPEHDMNPDESEISREVLQFLIEHSGTLLERVQNKAIEKHELAKKNGTVEDETAAPYVADPPPAGVPQLFVSDFAPRISQSNNHVRRHSKSVSSAQPPSLSLSDSSYGASSRESLPPFKEEGPKFPGFIRRQLSTRGNRSGSGSKSPSEEPASEDEGERKSRFRRSLMVLLPSSRTSRSPSPQR